MSLNLAQKTSQAISIAALAVISIWQPTLASWTFLVVFVLLLEGYILLLLYIHRNYKMAAHEAPHFFSENEAELVSKFAIHFMYPGTATAMSVVLAANAGAAFIFVPVLIYKSMYVEGILIGLNWFVALPLSYMLSPLNGMKAGEAKGDSLSAQRLAVWGSTWEKIIAAGRTRSNLRQDNGG